jgi:hypothetical protein
MGAARGRANAFFAFNQADFPALQLKVIGAGGANDSTANY